MRGSRQARKFGMMNVHGKEPAAAGLFRADTRGGRALRNPAQQSACQRACAGKTPRVPLQLTSRERTTLATILFLLILGLVGMAVLRDEPPERPAAVRDRPPPPGRT